MPKHLCHASGCTRAVLPRLVMCREHWAMVPAALKRDVWEHYRLGQENDKRPTALYLSAFHRAVASVAEAEGKTAEAELHAKWASYHAGKGVEPR